MSGPRIGSLCSGYGGLDLAAQAVLGGSIAWHSEIEPAAVRVLEHRWPGVPNIGDMTKADWSTVPPVDVLAGGTPCQDVSHAGRRAGMRAGTRSGLWSAMVDAIDVLRPQLVIWENVRGVLSAAADSDMEPCPVCVGDGAGAALRALGRVLGDLADSGYDARWCGLRAADVGAPHGRYRVFVVAQDTDLAAGSEWWLAAPGQAESGRTRPDAGGRGRAPATDARNDRRGGRTERDGGQVGRIEASHGHDADGCPDTAADTGTGADRGGPREAAAVVDWGQYRDAVERWRHTIGRVAPTPTEHAPKGGQRLAPRFVEWMMGLPAGWVTDVPGVTRNEALKMLGNGVVPQQAAAALDALAAR